MSEALNIIKASFGGLREVTTAPLWQWDYGQILQITGLDLPQAFEVHFSNSRKSGETVTQIGTDSQVTIPDMYLTSGADVYCFIFLHDGADDGETEYVIKIPVRERPEPSDIEPTPEQQDAITEAIAALNVAVEQSETNVDHYPCIIDGYWHVWDAQTEAFVSTGVEAQGNGIASAVLNADYTLTLTFTDGTTYITPSIRGAQGEQGDGGLSILLTRQAIVLPTDNNRIPQSALTASVEVTAVKGTEIVGLDDVSGSSVNMEYIDGQGRRHGTFVMPTIEVTYDDIRDINVKYKLTYEFKTSPYYFMVDSGNITLTIEIDGVTYKRTIPWTLSKQGIQGEQGETGITPDLTIGTVQTLPAGSQATASITGTDEEPVLSLGIPKGDAGDDYVLTEQDKEEIADIVLESDGLQSELNNKADIIISNAEGAIATFEDGGDDMPMVSCVVNIEPVQSGSGDPSPDNICPISGWTQVNVNHSDADMTNPTTITISLGQTIYGGKLDVLSGVLTVDMAMVDLGTLTWNYVASSALNFRASELIGAKAPANAAVKPNAICSILPVLDYITISTPVDGITIIFATSEQAGKVWARSGTYTDATAFKSAVTGQTLVYELAEPIEIQLSANQLNSLYGVNNIWADSGDCTAEYRADTKLFIERLTAPDSADMIADSNIVSGQYFMVGNNLYKATANIANGGQIIVGTNATRISLAQALNEINA